MIFKLWLDDARATYDVEVIEKPGDNHFTSKILHFSDPRKKGLSFEIDLNEIGEPSVFSPDLFEFEWFNIAEGASPQDILDAADLCLSGKLQIKQPFFGKKFRLEFNFASFRGKSKVADIKHSKIEGFRQGYTLRRIF